MYILFPKWLRKQCRITGLSQHFNMCTVRSLQISFDWIAGIWFIGISVCIRMMQKCFSFFLRWFCHVDDDTYINIPELSRLLKKFNHTEDWYLGKPSLTHPLEISDPEHKGVGTLISLSLSLSLSVCVCVKPWTKILPVSSFMHLGISPMFLIW